MKEIVIIGAGGHARELHQLIEDINAHTPTWHCRGFLDQDPARHGQLVHGLPVLGDLAYLADAPRCHVVIGVGNPALRRKLAAALGDVPFATLVHPQATVGNRVTLGAGTVVCVGARLTTDVSVGRHVLVNTGATISHDAVLSDYVTVAPNATLSGAVSIGEGVDVGTGSTLIQGVRIGAWSIIGAGSVVLGPIAADVTVVGVPATTIKTRAAGWHLD